MYITFHVKYPLFLSDFNETFSFSAGFRKVVKYQISLTPRPVGTELFHTDRWTDTQDEANSRFSPFCERS